MANNRIHNALLFLIILLLLFACTGFAVDDVSPLRSTICAQIINGDLEQAMITIRYNNLLYKRDPLIIGFISYAYAHEILHETPLAFQFYRKHYHKQILKSWQTLLKDNPDNPHILKIFAWLHVIDNPKKAEEYAGKAAGIDGDRAFLFHLMGVLHSNKSNFELAINEYRNAYTADGSLKNTVSLAYAHQRANHPDSALHYFLKVPHDDTTYNYFLFGAVLCYMQNGCYDKAISLLDSIQIQLTDFSTLEKIDTLIKYVQLYKTNSFIRSDSCVLIFGTLTVLLTCDSVLYFTTSDIRKNATFKKVKLMTKKEYHDNICAKGIKEQPYFIVLIDKNGLVFEIFPLISSGNYEIDEYLMQFLRKQTYSPATVFNKPTSSSIVAGGGFHYK